MQLPPQQIERFYRLWSALLYYVNEQRHLVPPFPADPGEGELPTSDALQLRNALWDDDTLLNGFIAINPVGLSAADLALVGSWQYRLKGSFFILRHLKKYSVFLSEDTPAHAYGVLGLVSPIEEVAGFALPTYVQAVLLPFEDKIIYDSLMQTYRVVFGSGIRGRLNETYRNVQEREGIIATLAPGDVPESADELRKGVFASNARVLSALRKDLVKRGLSQNMVEQHVGNIEAFAQTYLLAQDIPRRLLDTTAADVQTYLPAAGNKAKTVSFKRFVRFLTETGRMEYEDAEPLRELLKHVRE